METLISQFYSHVKSQGEKLALVFEERHVTYKELDRISGQIAAALIADGAKAEKIYPIVLPRGIEFIAAELAILKAGAAFSPLSVEYPADRIDYIRKDCGCDFVVDEAYIRKTETYEPLAEPVTVNEQDAAMVIYTSGSTGNPKGIIHDQYSFTRAIVRQIPIACKADGVEMSVTPFNFAISAADIFVPLWVGATIHILSEEDRKDVSVIEKYIDAHQITASVISPQMLKRMPSRKRPLVNICCGGERLSGIFQEYSTVYNSYGLSETLSVAIAFPLEQAYDNTPIGRPLEDYTVYIMDGEGRPVADGEEGEICIAGPLARGYINLPEQTARTFVENPYAAGALDRRMLHTNDMGRRLADGNIQYVNRKDWMVKINGQRVEMGEVEIQMGKVPGVETAVVKSFEDENGQTYLCGYYKGDGSVSEEDVRQRLSQKFPGYMIPRFLVQVGQFPLNANGKLDRKALEAPKASMFQKGYVKPENEIQQNICDGFQKVLGLDKVGAEDDFFAMGGDSIKVVILQDVLSKLQLSSSSIFEGRTPKKIAAICMSAKGQNNRYEGMDQKKEAYPMTDSQLGIYLECMREPLSCMYNNPESFTFGPEFELDPERLRKALVTVIEGYPFMKMHVKTRNGEPVIVPNERLVYEIPVKTIADNHENEGESGQKNLAKSLIEAFVKPFDLETGPLFRFEIDVIGQTVILLGDMHHIIADGTSTALVFNRTAQIYEGMEPEPEIIDSFTLSNYEETLSGSDEYKESSEFFDRMLNGIEVDSNPMPDDMGTDRGEKKSALMTVGLKQYLSIEEVREKSKAYGITESTLFLSAFSYALGKINGQDEVFFCTVDNGRHTPELRNTMGMLVRTLPFYVQVQEEEQCEHYLQRIQEQLFQCVKYDACSFVKLAAEYKVRSDIIFVYQGDNLNGITMEKGFVPMVIHKLGDSMANLSLDVLKRKDDYTLSFEYRCDLYTKETIEEFAGLVIAALRGLLERDCLKHIELCDINGQQKIASFNENEVLFDRELTMVDLFRKQVTETPKRAAVVYKDKVLTYQELDDKSERLAAALTKAGAGPEIPIGIMAGRSEIFPICVFGILKAGSACQPLDSNYPKERLKYMTEDSGAPIIVMDRDLEEMLPDYNGIVIYTDEIERMPLDPSVVLQAPRAENLFALLYTSGSTGKPKGCMIEHRNLVNFCIAFQERFGITCEDRASAYGSFGFDASMQDFYPYLTKGACVYIVPEEMRLDLPGLHEFFMKNKITMTDCTTQLGRQYVCEYKEDPYMRTLTVGGEKLVPCDPPLYPFVNTYGPTECTIYVTDFQMDRNYTSVPIGKPFGNCDIYIVDSYQRLLPVGAPGELCIAGLPVTRGYLNLPEMTAEKYVENPFNRKPGYERMYRTGDVCRYLPDGNIQFVGRRDEQVKIRGFRIELTEIERRIRAFSGIQNACVTAYELPAGGKAIAAYVTSKEEVDIAALNAFIREKLPAYMVPSVTMQIEAIPLNPNGKVDKRKLPEPKVQIEKRVSAGRIWNHLEQGIKGVITDIIGTDEFDVDTSLMTIGFTSLSTIILATKLMDQFGCKLNVNDLIEGGSVLSIENAILDQMLTARQISGQGNEKQEEAIEIPDKVPLSSAQLGVYYDAMKRPEELLYNIPMMYSFDSEIDAEKLAGAVSEVIEMHPVMSVHLEAEGTEVVQVWERGRKAVPVIHLDEAALTKEKKAFAKPFHLFKGPLHREKIVQTKERTALLFDVHHIIFDGLSLGAFLEDVKKAYEGQGVLPERKSFFESVLEEKLYAKGEEGKKAEQYYERLFGAYESASDVPADLHGKAEDGSLGECVTLLDEKVIDGFCREHHITAAQLCLAGTCYTVSRYTGDQTVYLSMISGGREEIAYQDSFGMFVHTLPLSASVKEERSVLAFIQSCAGMMREAVSYSGYPFIQLRDRYNYIPQINYAYQLGVDVAMTLEGGRVKEEVLTQPLPKFHISVHIERREGNMAVCIQYNDALYSRTFMQGMADALAECVNQMVKAPKDCIRYISLLNEKERERLKAFGMGPVSKTEENLFHKAFERQAALHPNHTALIAADGTFQYTELNEAMNRVAAGLYHYGVRKGDRVAILLPRTSRMVMAMYGVLKAGAVYIPCDPEYPEDRIQYILEDSGAKYVLTTTDRVEKFGAGTGLDMEALCSGEWDERPEADVSSDDLAYMIYTSGSTGRPKGVMLTHGGITNYLYSHPGNRHIYALATEAHTMISVTTVSFDMSLKETAAALCNGLTLVLASEEEANNPVLLAALFQRTNGDAFNATPSRMAQYLGMRELRDAIGKCKIVMCGGEKYSPKLLEQLKKVTSARIFNTYGPTEITVSCNAKELTNETQISIGKPLLNVQEFIADPDGNELPAGVVGELYVGGAGVARGYLNQEKLTKEKFREYHGVRIYATGDYAKWTMNGDVEILGRTDNQVKLRGLRIELGEIEKQLLSDTRIQEAVVLIREIHETEHLCAYYTADEQIKIEELKAFLGRSLTAYMVPTAYCQLPKMPMTPNGKIDARALPDAVLYQGGGQIAPANETERKLCGIFAKNLHLDSVGATDSFFELGGTSLTVTNVLIEANECGLAVSYGDVFQAQTPRKLAEILLRAKTETEAEEYDYHRFDRILKNNTLDAYLQGEQKKIGNLLLTGAAGYLGIHILHAYIEQSDGTVYCLLRGGKGTSAKDRLQAKLFYYFEQSYDELFGKRIHVIEGDVTETSWKEELKPYSIQTVINCAAVVKHFASGTEIEDVNVGGVRNLIQFCKESGSLLIQISTGSVAGDRVDNVPDCSEKLNEQSFYFGQNIDNQYVHSKFMAERFVLEAIEEGVSAKIMRVGNLSARDVDGEFQINFSTNGFVGRLKAYAVIGEFPYSAMNTMVEMAPVDSTANAILMLAETPDDCCIFHPYNNHYVPLGDIILRMRHMGIEIQLSEDDAFAEALKHVQEDAEKAKRLTTLLAYENMDRSKKIEMIETDNEFTTQILYRMGFQWPTTSEAYMNRFLEAIGSLGFFTIKK